MLNVDSRRNGRGVLGGLSFPSMSLVLQVHENSHGAPFGSSGHEPHADIAGHSSGLVGQLPRVHRDDARASHTLQLRMSGLGNAEVSLGSCYARDH